jgi:hypothetical protein
LRVQDFFCSLFAFLYSPFAIRYLADLPTSRFADKFLGGQRTAKSSSGEAKLMAEFSMCEKFTDFLIPAR